MEINSETTVETGSNKSTDPRIIDVQNGAARLEVCCSSSGYTGSSFVGHTMSLIKIVVKTSKIVKIPQVTVQKAPFRTSVHSSWSSWWTQLICRVWPFKKGCYNFALHTLEVG